MTFRILYIHTYSFWEREECIMSIFYRISNYLNSRKNELNDKIEEEYIDLGYEPLPKFSLDGIELYRKKLRDLLISNYPNFRFDIVLISCYSSYSYINCLEVAGLIKYDINPNALIAIGGLHPTIRSEDFQPQNFPKYFYKKYSISNTPIDYIIKEEGELPFFNLVKSIIDRTIQKRECSSDKCVLIPSQLILNLDEIPLIDLSIFKKYENIIRNIKDLKLWIDFSRGCPFKCSFCLNSGDSFPCYKAIRIKSVNKCIEEIRAIKTYDWIPIKSVCFSDLIFLPKRSVKNQFFSEMKDLIRKEGELPFELSVMDRIEFCSIKDLESYKELNIVVDFGIESFSAILLNKINKVLGKNHEEIENGIQNYLKKTEALLEKATEIDGKVTLNFLFCMPGTNKEVLEEERKFLLEKRYNGKSFVEKFKFRFGLNNFMAYYGTKIFQDAETFGSTIYFKEWWKIFDQKQLLYASLVSPSNELSFLEAYRFYTKLIKEILDVQNNMENSYYDKLRILKIRFKFKQSEKMYEEILESLEKKN